MKKISCTAMGGGDKCQEVFEGETADELLKKATEHVMQSPLHEDIRKEMESQNEEGKQKWMDFYHKLWQDTPEQ